MNRDELKQKIKEAVTNDTVIEDTAKLKEDLMTIFNKTGFRLPACKIKGQIESTLLTVAADERLPDELVDLMAESVNDMYEDMPVIYDLSKDSLLATVQTDLNIELPSYMKQALWLAYLKGCNISDDTYQRELNVCELELEE